MHTLTMRLHCTGWFIWQRPYYGSEIIGKLLVSMPAWAFNSYQGTIAESNIRQLLVSTWNLPNVWGERQHRISFSCS
jgi:hypothetical protein